MLAFLPLGTALLYSMAHALGLYSGIVSSATLAGSLALVVIDKRELARTGRLAPSTAPSTLWCLFPPGYLRRRARLLVEPGGRFWISLACMGLAFAAQTAVLAGATAEPTSNASATPGTAAPTDASVQDAPALPECTDEGSTQDVVDLFGRMEPMLDAHVQGVVLTERAEVPGGELEHPAVRRCTGTMRASNEESYALSYVFDIVEGHVVVHLQLR